MIKEASKDIQDPDLDKIDGIVQDLKKNFLDGRTQDLAFRKAMLKTLIRGCEEMEKEMIEALKKDLSTDECHNYVTNIMVFKNEAYDCISHLQEWTQPRVSETPLGMWPGKAYVKPQPRGVVCVLGSWNFPINSLGPAVSAIAAGNCVIIKPSEFSPASSHIMRKLFDKYLDQRYYRCVEGAVQTGIKLTNTPFDAICFTGSTFTGKLIAKAASAHLTPLILELGGKCPTVVDRNANLELAARRIISGKFGNCGQVCLAPDYVFVHKEIMNQFVPMLKKEIEQQFGKDPKNNYSYGRLIHEAHVKRTEDMLKGHEDKILAKYGDVDRANRFFPPTLILEPDTNTQIMKEEIFSPLLPIYPYETPIDVIKFIQQGARPLAVYYFGNPDSIVRQRLEEGTTSGGFVVNDCIVHFAVNSLPFGGIGDSGYGATHGKYGFDQFCNLRAVLERPNSLFLDMAFRYAGEDPSKRLAMMKKFEFGTRLSVDTVFKYGKGAIFLAFLWIGLWLGVKYRLVAFPAFGIN